MTTEDKIWCASFDIGKINFCFYIEEFDKSEILSYEVIPKPKRYNPNGTPTKIFQEQLDKICNNGKKILIKNSNLTANCKKGSYIEAEMFHNMTDLLDEHKEYFDKCDVFLVEQQVSFGNKRNTMALKLGQHCQSYFHIAYGRFKNVVEFPSYHKTQVLGCEKIQNKTKKGKITYKTIDQRSRKKWSVERATEILHNRGDTETMASLTSVKKKDDLADVLCQLQAFKILAFVDKIYD